MLAEPDHEHLRVAGSSGLSREYVGLVSDEGHCSSTDGPAPELPAAESFRGGRTVAVPDSAAPPGTGGCATWPAPRISGPDRGAVTCC